MIAPLGLFPHQLLPLAAVEGLSRRRAKRMTALWLGSLHPTVATAKFKVGPELFICVADAGNAESGGGATQEGAPDRPSCGNMLRPVSPRSRYSYSTSVHDPPARAR